MRIMKKIYYLFMSMTVILLAACSQEEVEQVKVDTLPELQVIVNHPSAISTRASIKKFATTFGDGDKIGLFAVDESRNLVYTNIPYVFHADENAWVLDDASKKVYYSENFKYFAYYPYQAIIEDPSIEVDEDDDGTAYWYNTLASYADDASEFFEYLISKWEPQLDQSSFDSYIANDLMVGKGTNHNENASVSFIMNHQMSLLLFQLRTADGGPINAGDLDPEKKYFDDYSQVDLTVTSYSVPYNDGVYFRYIGKPNKPYTFVYTSTGQNGNPSKGEYSHTPPDEAGTILIVDINGLQELTDDY